MNKTDPSGIFEFAWTYYSEIMETPRQKPDFVVESTRAVQAGIRRREDKYELTISEGCVEALQRVWNNVAPELMPEAPDGCTPPSRDEWVELSLRWMIYHELGHLHLQHFQFMPKQRLSLLEVNDAGFSLRPDVKSKARQHGVSGNQFRKCLEMQADNFATRCILGVLSEHVRDQDLYDMYCCGLAGLCSVLLLDNQPGGNGPHHPAPETRLFLMLNLILQFAFESTIEKTRDNTLKTSEQNVRDAENTIHRYRDLCCIPMVEGATVLCLALRDEHYAEELGLSGDLILDVQRIMLRKADTPIDTFKTNAAKDLIKLNRVEDFIQNVFGPI